MDKSRPIYAVYSTFLFSIIIPLMIVEIRITTFFKMINPGVLRLFRCLVQAAGTKTDTGIWSVFNHTKITVHGCHSCLDDLVVIFDKIACITYFPLHISQGMLWNTSLKNLNIYDSQRICELELHYFYFCIRPGNTVFF